MQAMDEDFLSKNVLIQFSDLFTILLAYPANVEAFLTCQGDDLLYHAEKMYNNEQVKSRSWVRYKTCCNTNASEISKFSPIYQK